MSDKYILNDRGEAEACDLETWARWFEQAERRICLDQIGDVKVSTVFLGIDHSFGSGPPLLFETMVFGGPNDGDCERYSTKAEAMLGHQVIANRERALAPTNE